ncbi:MAG: c-type cytochrome, partial [Myxococcales bacterium]|nr:c-type cytochrome [Myxococcales bacterium]
MSEVQGRHDEIQGEILHEYDGIEEADNQLPLWWVAGFLFTVVFGLVYWFGYEVFGTQPSPDQEYAVRSAELEAARAEQAANATEVTAEGLEALAADSTSLAAGKAIFATNCVACHADRGQGGIGPNLTDRFWIHGADPLTIHRTIDQGVPAKGMTPWGPVLGHEAVRQVTAFDLP